MRALAAFIRRVNLRHWARHRLRTVLTLLGVTTGVTLVVAIAVINTTLLSTVEDTARTMGGSADIEVAAPDSTGLSSQVVDAIADVEGVDAAVPVIRSYTELKGPKESRRVLILGTTYDFHKLFHEEILEDGSLEITAESMSLDGVILSADSADADGCIGRGSHPGGNPFRHDGCRDDRNPLRSSDRCS